MVPLLGRLAHASVVAARKGRGLSMHTLPLTVGTTPMRLRIHNDGGLGPGKNPS